MCPMFTLHIISNPYNDSSRKVISTLIFRWENELRKGEELAQVSTEAAELGFELCL